MPQLSIPIEFFKKERTQVYSGWRLAFWRELFANAIDAGATKIWIDCSNEFIQFLDNGSGMSRDVCENIYLKLGGSSKASSSDGVGGFGRARILTCFSMNRYTVRSHDYLLEGCGADYTLRGDQPHMNGFQLRVEDNFTNERMEYSLRNFLKACFVPGLTVVFNGDTLDTENFPRKEETPLETPFGSFSIESHEPDLHNYSVVRVNGLEMFRTTQNGLKQKTLLLELFPEKSRDNMTANRDAPKAELENAIRGVIQKLSREGSDGVKNKPVNIKKVFAGKAPWRTAFAGQSGRGGTSTDLPGVRTTQGRGDESTNGVTFHGSPVLFRMAAGDPKLIEAGRAWDPMNWATKPNNDKKWLLLAAWGAAVEAALEVYGKAFQGTEQLTWTIGINIGSAEALYEASMEGSVFYINPLKGQFHDDKSDYAPRFNFNKKPAWNTLIALALHEVAHLYSDDHDSGYANALTAMIEKMDQGDMLQAAKAAYKKMNFQLFKGEPLASKTDNKDREIF